MADANARIVELAFTSFNERGTEALLAYVHPGAEFTTPPELASEPDTYRGHEGVRRYFGSFYEAMDSVRFEPAGLVERDGVVVGEFQLKARGKSTGIETALRAFAVISIEDEMIHRVSVHPTLARAEAEAEAEAAAAASRGGRRPRRR